MKFDKTTITNFLKTEEIKKLSKDFVTVLKEIVYNEIYPYIWFICIYNVFLIFLTLVNIYFVFYLYRAFYLASDPYSARAFVSVPLPI